MMGYANCLLCACFVSFGRWKGGVMGGVGVFSWARACMGWDGINEELELLCGGSPFELFLLPLALGELWQIVYINWNFFVYDSGLTEMGNKANF